MNTHVVDQEARDMATVAQNQIITHEHGCEIRWNSTMATMREIKAIIAWGVTGIIGAMGGLIAFLATHPPH